MKKLSGEIKDQIAEDLLNDLLFGHGPGIVSDYDRYLFESAKGKGRRRAARSIAAGLLGMCYDGNKDKIV